MSAEQTRRVAVVAVPGVADQKPHVTARTHYWDQPRPDPIGAALDRLIRS